MSLYSNGKIFGISIYNFNGVNIGNTLFEKVYSKIMNNEQKTKAYLFYTQLNNKNDVFFKIYTEMWSTHNMSNNKINKGKCMMWYPISLDLFLKNFGNLKC